MEALLRALLPRLIGERASYQMVVFQGKDDLLKKLPDRLRGFASWLPDTHRIVVLVDRDNDDCTVLKQHLESACAAAGLNSRSRGGPVAWSVVTRLAIEELEAWYFGDWEAVRAAYPRCARDIPSKSAFCDPEAIQGGTWEAFERVMQKAGYFKGGLRKIEAARTIGKHLNPSTNAAPSFHRLVEAIEEALA